MKRFIKKIYKRICRKIDYGLFLFYKYTWLLLVNKAKKFYAFFINLWFLIIIQVLKKIKKTIFHKHFLLFLIIKNKDGFFTNMSLFFFQKKRNTLKLKHNRPFLYFLRSAYIKLKIKKLDRFISLKIRKWNIFFKHRIIGTLLFELKWNFNRYFPRVKFLFELFWEELEDAWQCFLDGDLGEMTMAIYQGFVVVFKNLNIRIRNKKLRYYWALYSEPRTWILLYHFYKCLIKIHNVLLKEVYLIFENFYIYLNFSIVEFIKHRFNARAQIAIDIYQWQYYYYFNDTFLIIILNHFSNFLQNLQSFDKHLYITVVRHSIRFLFLKIIYKILLLVNFQSYFILFKPRSYIIDLFNYIEYFIHYFGDGKNTLNIYMKIVEISQGFVYKKNKNYETIL